MWEFHDYAVIIMTILGCIFPAKIIEAIRSDDEEKSERNKIAACVCFGGIVLMIGMFLNR